MVDRLYEDYGDEVYFAILNPEEDARFGELADRHQVNFVPTFVFVDADGEVVEKIVGGASEETLRRHLEELL